MGPRLVERGKREDFLEFCELIEQLQWGRAWLSAESGYIVFSTVDSSQEVSHFRSQN